MRIILLAGLLMLVACATPQEQCISRATEQVGVMNKLIASTKRNVARGYAVRSEEYFETEEQICGEVDGKPVYCDIPVAKKRNVPVAIDLNVEKAKLRSLRVRRDKMAAIANAAAQECRRAFPEG